MCFCKAKLAFPQVIMAAAQIINTNNYHQRIDDEHWVYFFNFPFKMQCSFHCTDIVYGRLYSYPVIRLTRCFYS